MWFAYMKLEIIQHAASTWDEKHDTAKDSQNQNILLPMLRATMQHDTYHTAEILLDPVLLRGVRKYRSSPHYWEHCTGGGAFSVLISQRLWPLCWWRVPWPLGQLCPSCLPAEANYWIWYDTHSKRKGTVRLLQYNSRKKSSGNNTRKSNSRKRSSIRFNLSARTNNFIAYDI